jgi:hypothetical protein
MNSEQKQEEAPAFLRVACVSIASACVAYLILFMNGGAMPAGSRTLMYAAAAIGTAFFAGVSVFAATSSKPEAERTSRS